MMYRKLVRTLLFAWPWLYDLLSSQWRYRWLGRLGFSYEHRDYAAIASLVHTEDPFIVDVGANQGQSIMSMKRIWPAAPIVAFEPSPVHRKSLESIERKWHDVRFEYCGLGAIAGELTLYTPVYNGKIMTGLASFNRSEAAVWLSRDKMFGFRASRLKILEEICRVDTLDDFCLRPDLIKVDVQGLEEEVLEGAIGTIRECRPLLLIEAPSPRLRDRLKTFGYCEYADLPSGNTLFTPGDADI